MSYRTSYGGWQFFFRFPVCLRLSIEGLIEEAMADDKFGFVSEKVIKRATKDAPPNLLSSSSQTSQASFRSDISGIYSRCFGRFLTCKLLSTKNYALVSICFLATLLVSCSIIVVASYSTRLGLDDKLHLFHKIYPRLQANNAKQNKLPDEGMDNSLRLKGSTFSGFGSPGQLDSESLSLKILENGSEVLQSPDKVADESCTVKHATLRIYMYDLPPEFHFGMITQISYNSSWPKNNEIPRYPGGLNQQHSPEYWLTADLLSSISPERPNPCVAVWVKEHSLADAYFVPFFSSLSYNRYSRAGHKAQADHNEILQQRLVEFLLKQESWRTSKGRNHIIPMHHPNSLHSARQHLQNAIYIVSDFGRYSKQVANLAKDVVAPYKHIVPYIHNDSTSFDSRSILIFFQGAIVRKEGGAIRQNLHELLKGEEGVHFATGSTQSSGVRSATQGMRSAKFCLHLAGDTPSSNRLFDAIASHCVPVIISDEIELPYEDQLDYAEFCLFVRSSDALKKGFLIKLLKSIRRMEWNRMWQKLHEVAHHFEFQHPTQPDDAVEMIWKAVARKLSSVRLLLHKNKRFWRSGLLH